MAFLPAQSLAADPAAPIHSFEAQLKSSQSKTGSFEYAAVARAAAGTLNLDAMARFVLGPRAAQSSAAERDRIAAVLVARITRELNRRRGNSADAHLSIVRTRPIGNGEWLVTTTATSANDTLAVLTWRVRGDAGGPLIVDVLSDGASMLIPIRRELALALAREDLDTVIGRMERKYGAPAD